MRGSSSPAERSARFHSGKEPGPGTPGTPELLAARRAETRLSRTDISRYEGERGSRADGRERKTWIWCETAAGQRRSNRTGEPTEQGLRSLTPFRPTALE